MKPFLSAHYLVLCALPFCARSNAAPLASSSAAQSTLSAPEKIAAPDAQAYRRLADEVQANLQTQVLAKWFPAAVDNARGGFHQNFGEDWARLAANDRALVYQARLTWLAAQIAGRTKNEYTHRVYRAYSKHGLDFLDQKMWDAQNGGFFWGFDENGQAVRGGEKHVYGIAFAIYAASTNFQNTRDPRALDLARRAFVWLDNHAHDNRNGGYFEALKRNGDPILTVSDPTQAADEIGTRYGFKSMNTHIHLLEALTSLHHIWPEAKVRARLQEVFGLVRDRIVVAPVGVMNLYFTPDWKPIPDHDSFGHDVETAFLLVEAAAELGFPNDAATWKASRMLVDHALEWGWDNENGGFYDSGPTFGAATVTDKIWWVEAEGLNALLLMHERFGAQTPRYWEAFNRQWRFIQNSQIDGRFGGWHPSVSASGAAVAGRAKSDGWTEAYHQGRALLHVGAALRHLAEKR